MVSAHEFQPPAGSDAVLDRRDSQRFYNRRRQVYTALLLFVVVVGLPIVGVPYLRHRLSSRVLTLKAAMAGTIKPAFARVGANPEPFPAEYERPAPAVPHLPQLPPMERVFTAKTPGSYVPPRIESRLAPKMATTRIAASPPPAESEEPAEKAGAAASTDTGPKYQKGKMEQEAYDLLLKSNSTIAGMVQGRNPALHFKSWDAANRGEDIYWVRLMFQSGGNPDVEYIWQVKLQAGQVTPLSYNARTLP